ncbi:amino acid adenylation domain-containing protein [Streptosporangium sp. G11]|uniref:non-ribosomal peptide synthetase n=1 Tax=Streptosporangium sp. G11 TaxID=3436926 RepID=UPI003EBB8FE5
MSPMQYAMLLHSVDAADTGAYVIQMLVTVHDAMDLPRFERALRTLVRRHPTLRTGFLLDHPDGPSQVVRDDVPVEVSVHDLRHLTDRDARIREYLDADKVRSFDLADGPPMRFALIRTGDEEYRFVWTCHHALMDGRSCVISVTELFGLYDGTPAGEPRTPRPYADYIGWLSGLDRTEAEAFWRAHLAGIGGPAPLVVDSAREPDPGGPVFGAVTDELPEETAERLYARAGQHRVTPNNIVQAAWAVLLHRLSGQDDVVFGAVRACRSFLDGADAMIGMFVNTLPFRVTVRPEATVAGLWRALRHDQIALRGVEHSSPAQIRRWAGIRTPGPLFESVVAFENYDYASHFASMGGAWSRREAAFEGHTGYPLTLSAYRGGRLVLNLGHDRRRFTEAMARRLLAYLRALVEAMISAPDGTVAELPAPAGLEAGPPEAVTAPADREAWWVERLATLKPLCPPLGRARAGQAGHEAAPVPLPGGIDAMPARERARWLLTGVLTFLSRYVGEDGHDIEVSGPAVPGAGPDRRTARHLPFRLPAVVDGQDFASFRAEMARRLDVLAGRGAFSPDVWARHPRLRSRSSPAEDGLPVVVESVEDFGADAVARPGTVLLLQIRSDGGACRLLLSREAGPGLTPRTLSAGLAAYLRAAADAPGTAVTRLPLMPEHERHRVLVAWNDTAAEYPRDECVHELFARQAVRRPHAPAVVFEGRTLTYRELDDRSTRLAAYLRGQGAGRGHAVGVYLERSAEMVVALLAVMKTGAAFVPLDPIYPAERIARIVSASGLSLLLTQSGLEAGVRGQASRLVVLDRLGEAISRAGRPRGDLAVPLDPVYLISTSGSTGDPKLVRIGHRGLTNILCSLARTLGVTEADTLLAVTTVCFDMAYVELFLPLITGGSVDVAPARAVTDGFELRGRVEDGRPTIMQATPATWRMLIAAGWAGDARLTVLCGGEAMSRDLADALLGRAGRVWNGYGPTETTIFSTLGAVVGGEPVTIGRPVANTRLFVLDPWGRPVPPGTPGELYIGGDGVAAGYLGDPDLTRARFVRDPLRTGDERLYRTGDQVRYLPDGRLEFLGRLDDQVKVNGYRVEPGEIEAALREHPEVVEAVVVRDDAPGARHLVGYVTTAETARPALTARLRDHLMAILPRYMVPAALVIVPRLPRTPNGKVDRRSLPRPPDARLLAPDVPYVAPRTTVERAVAAIWCGVLGLDRIGADENFFDAGGDSLLLTYVTSRLRADFDASLTHVDMFAHPTIRSMARHLSRPPSDGARMDGARMDGARADGARADGARADGARADGARADGARADGARVAAGDGTEGRAALDRLRRRRQRSGDGR